MLEHSPDSALVVSRPAQKAANAEKAVLGALLCMTINLRETPAGRDVVRRCREPALATRGISIDGGAPAQLCCVE